MTKPNRFGFVNYGGPPKPVANYMAQSLAAAREHEETFKRLREQGWTRDESGVWVNPAVPGVAISE